LLVQREHAQEGVRFRSKSTTMFDGECMVMSWEEYHVVERWGVFIALFHFD
jgi:hypothetical protein